MPRCLCLRGVAVMEINNIGHFRVTDYERRGMYTLFNTTSGDVYDISRKEYEDIREHMSIEACKFVEMGHVLERKTIVG